MVLSSFVKAQSNRKRVETASMPSRCGPYGIVLVQILIHVVQQIWILQLEVLPGLKVMTPLAITIE